MSPWKNPEDEARWRQLNRGRRNGLQRQRRAANPQPHRASSAKWGAANREYRNYRASVYRHGPDVAEAMLAMWEEQQGCCYLCGIYLVPESVVIDHDHRCCPKQTSCRFCRRGLACPYCNTLVGLAHDDPAVLRQIADNLEAAIARVDERLAQKPQQLRIDGGEDR